MGYKVLLVDIDGVMINRPRLFTEKLESQFSIDTSCMQPFFAGPFKECTLGRADLKEKLADVIQDWPWKGTVDELMHFWLNEGTEINPLMSSYIEELAARGFDCYITTEQEKYRAEKLRDLLVRDGLFKNIFYSAALGFSKKVPDFFQKVTESLGPISKKEILLIDDSPEVVANAQAFGIETYLFTDFEKFKQDMTRVLA